MLVSECHCLLLWHSRGAEWPVRKVVPQDKRCSARVVGVVVAARCDRMVVVLWVLVVKMWAYCSVYLDDPSYRDLF